MRRSSAAGRHAAIALRATSCLLIACLAASCSEKRPAAATDVAVAVAECDQGAERMFPEAPSERQAKLENCLEKKFGADWRSQIGDLEPADQ